MGTSFEEVYEAFFDLLEKDDNFFEYYDLSEDEAMRIAKSRSNAYLIESVAYLKRKCRPDIDFAYDNISKTFIDELTLDEVDLLAHLCFLQYLKRDLAQLRTRVNTFSSSDLKALYSPAAERNSFITMVNDYENKCITDISNYGARDRISGALKTIRYSQYADDL